jgi:tripartite-type tricarboxylate transporter receptor subunit TctC
MLGAIGSALVIAPAAAQSPLKIVYPFPAGGTGDAVARIFAEHLQKSLGRPVIVENKTGAGGRIGVTAAKDAPADGSVLLFTATGQLAIQPHVIANPGYDPFSDFAPIAEIASSELALAVTAKSEARSVQDLVAWIKANPDQATFASAGAGTSAYFAGLEFARAFDLTLRHVPYRGATAAVPDVIAGRVPLLFAITAELIPHHASNGIRILATAGARRSTFLPDVPTFQASGIDLIAPNGFSFYVPARTPADIVERLEREIVAASRSTHISAKLADLNLTPTGTSQQELRALLGAQFESWRAIVQKSGFKPE